MRRHNWNVAQRNLVKNHTPEKSGDAIREFALNTGCADYLLYVDAKALGMIEAKTDGITLTGVAEQSPHARRPQTSQNSSCPS